MAKPCALVPHFAFAGQARICGTEAPFSAGQGKILGTRCPICGTRRPICGRRLRDKATTAGQGAPFAGQAFGTRQQQRDWLAGQGKICGTRRPICGTGFRDKARLAGQAPSAARHGFAPGPKDRHILFLALSHLPPTSPLCGSKIPSMSPLLRQLNSTHVTAPRQPNHNWLGQAVLRSPEVDAGCAVHPRGLNC